MNRIVFVTGASSGFGKAIAEKFAAIGDHLIITARRGDALQSLKKDLETRFGIKVLSLEFDVRDKEVVFKTIENLPDEWKEIDILINNAGLALGRDSFDSASLDDWETMIDTNVKGLLYVSKAIMPFFVRRNKGHIINMGSVAAKEVYDKGNVYCATKNAVESISHSMRIELLPHHIKVTAIHPGAAVTEFSMIRFKGDQEKADAVYTGFKPLSAEDVADTVLYCCNLPEHVCINDLVITPTAQADAIYIHRE
ncbi:SDR family NAD(P)-dependent oxidoreductase [Pollutibacter soli]|uniref:SDR family NAD(P)-dependent oxidoreductase n=1 Tax=Pollutibacter soli TaxID=3034157 RepID=UPI0030133116